MSNTGRWASSPAWDWGHTAIHMVLLPGDATYHSRLLTWEGSTPSTLGGRLWGWSPGQNGDCAGAPSTSFTTLSLGSNGPGHDLFCAGHTTMGDKRVFIAGGTESGEIGVKNAVIFDPDAANKWTTAPDMEEPRWYPNAVRLPSSKLMVTSGSQYAMMHVYGGTETGTSHAPKDSLRRIGLPLLGAWHTPVENLASTAQSWHEWPARVRGAGFAWSEILRNDGVFYKRFLNRAMLFGGDELEAGEWISRHGTRQFLVEDQPFESDEGYLWHGDQPDGAAENTNLLRRSGHALISCPPPTNGSPGGDPGWIVFGGRRLSSGPDTTYLNDVWHLQHDGSVANPALLPFEWRQGGVNFTIANPQLAPGTKRYGAAAFYDPRHRRVLIYGGSADGVNPVANDTVYALTISDDTNTMTWSRIVPAIANGARPRPRFGHAMVFDNLGRRRAHVDSTAWHYFRGLLFGGRTSDHADSLSNQLWSLWIDPNNAGNLEWRFVEYAGSTVPAGRAFHVMVKDDYSDRLVVFGGDVAGSPDKRPWSLELPLAGAPRAASGFEWADEPASGAGTFKWSPEPFPFGAQGEADVSLTGAAGIVLGKPSFSRHAERYGADGSTRSTLSNSVMRQEWYPFNFVLPDGSLFTCGPTTGDTSKAVSYRLSNPEGNVAWQQYPAGTAAKLGLHAGTAAMYRPGRILVAGSNDLHAFQPASNQSRWIPLDSTTATWNASIDTMRARRANHNLVILPNGQVLAVGGTGEVDRNDQPRKRPELWDPLAFDAGSGRYGRWYDAINGESLADQTQVRGYHSTAILLPDGRVLSSGGNNDPGEKFGEIFCPPYLFNASGALAARPEITSTPAAVSWGSTFTVCVSDTTGIRRAALVAAASTTHGFDQNQRYIPLTMSRSPYGQQLYLTAPTNGNVAPPGYYMLFLIGKHDGTTHHPDVPSIASWVRVNPGGRDTCDTIRPAIHSDFAVDAVYTTSVDLSWSESGDDSTSAASGRVPHFDVRWSSAAISTTGAWDQANSWSGEPTPAGAGSGHAWTKSQLQSCTRYYVANRSPDDNQNLSLLHGTVTFKTLGTGCGTLLADRGAGTSRMERRGATTAEAVPAGNGTGPLVVETVAGVDGGWTVRASRVTEVDGVAAADASAIVAQVPDGAGGWRTVNRIGPPEGEDLVGLCALRDGGRYVLPADYSIEQVGTSMDGRGGPLAIGEVSHSADGALVGASLADPSATDLAPGETLTAVFSASGGEGEADGSWHVLVRRRPASTNLGQGGAGAAAILPARFALLQNAPNPFGATTTIGFELPRASRVKLELFDLLGRRVRTLTDHVWPAGRHGIAWDRLTDRGERLSSGVLLYRMTADGFRDQKKLVIGGK